MFGKDGGNSPGVIGFVGRGISIEGRLVFEHTIRLEGAVKGEIEGLGTLIVAEGADVEAEIKVTRAVITGTVRGLIEATDRVEIIAPGRVLGEIRTPNLIIGAGAVFEGNSVMVDFVRRAQPYAVDYGPHATEMEEAGGGAGGAVAQPEPVAPPAPPEPPEPVRSAAPAAAVASPVKGGKGRGSRAR